MVTATVLDGLAWTTLTEKARVARISAKLVRELVGWNKEHTKAFVKDAVRETLTPYGRGKYIFAAVEEEYRRQLPIYQKRKEAHDAWKKHQEHKALRATRLNDAYAHAFDRPTYARGRPYDSPWGSDDYWNKKSAWDREERARDRGDICEAITHQDGYVVALVSRTNEQYQAHIAVRKANGPTVRTHLRCIVVGLGETKKRSLVEAAISLGGPKVRSALVRGLKVKTDWVGRRSFIHHEERNHQSPYVEELPWRIAVLEQKPGKSNITTAPAITISEVVTKCELDMAETIWNDID